MKDLTPWPLRPAVPLLPADTVARVYAPFANLSVSLSLMTAQ